MWKSNHFFHLSNLSSFWGTAQVPTSRGQLGKTEDKMPSDLLPSPVQFVYW